MELRRTRHRSPGKHFFDEDKYEPWQKTLCKSRYRYKFELHRLIPTKRNYRGKTFDSLRSVSLSPAGNFLMGFGVKGKTPILTIGDIRDTNKDKEKVHRQPLRYERFGWLIPCLLTILRLPCRWDRDSRYALVKHSYPAENNLYRRAVVGFW